MPYLDPSVAESVNNDIESIIQWAEARLAETSNEVAPVAEGGAIITAFIVEVLGGWIVEIIIAIVVLIILVLAIALRDSIGKILNGVFSGPLNWVVSNVEGWLQSVGGHMTKTAHKSVGHFKQAVFATVPGLDWEHLPSFLSWVSNTVQDVYDTLHSHGVQIAQIRGSSQKSLADLEKDLAHIQSQIEGISGTLSAFETFLPTLTKEIAHWKTTLETQHHYNQVRDQQIHSLWVYSNKVGDNLSWLNRENSAITTWINSATRTISSQATIANRNFAVLWPLLHLMPLVAAGTKVRTEMIAQGKDPCRCFHLEGSEGNLMTLVSLYDLFVHG